MEKAKESGKLAASVLNTYSSLSRRVGAFLLDFLIVYGALTAALYPVAGQISEHLVYTRLIGPTVFLVYLTLLNGPMGRGHTIGKRLCGIRTVGTSGGPIGLGRSFLRSAILLAPLFFYQLDTFWAGIDVDGIYLPTALTFLKFGLPAASLILLLFNKPARQLVHDLVAKTLVVRSAATLEAPARLHAGAAFAASVFAIASLAAPVAVFTLVLPKAVENTPAADTVMQSLAELSEKVSATPGVQESNVTSLVVEPYGGRRIRVLSVNVNCGLSRDPQAIVMAIARTVIEETPDLLGNETLFVGAACMLDLGGFNLKSNFTHEATYADWKHLLDEQTPPREAQRDA